jgi:hypothetical protein
VSPDDFFYTSHGQAPEIDGVDDAEDMMSARDALTMLGKGTKQGGEPENMMSDREALTMLGKGTKQGGEPENMMSAREALTMLGKGTKQGGEPEGMTSFCQEGVNYI